jgi:hypothetical protein
MRVTPAQFDRLDALARKAGVSISALIRRAILGDPQGG